MGSSTGRVPSCSRVRSASRRPREEASVRRLLLTAGMALVLVALAASRTEVWYLGRVTPVSAPGAASPQQVWAGADPSDASRLIVCGRMSDPADNLDAGYVSASSDGGATWRRTLLENSTRWVSEESCAYGRDGRVYFVAGASDFYDGVPHHATGHIHVYASRDGGLTWRRTWTRKAGWLDWTSTADSYAPRSDRDTVVVFANEGTDRLGHWFARQPVAVASDDNAKNFSALIAPAASRFTYTAVWAGGNTVLPDGTVLFAASSARVVHGASENGWGNGEVAVQVFAFDPNSRTLNSRAVLRVLHGVPIFTAAIAQDRSSGRFRGRLYIAWVEERQRRSALWLATSDDRGYHWHTRVIAHGEGTDFPADCTQRAPIDEVRVATAPDGDLGVAWIENRALVRFSISRDAGETFAEPVTLARSDTAALVPFEAITWNDYWLEAELDVESGKPNPQALWSRVRGLGVVMGRNTLSDISLVADRSGRFHVFWIPPQGAAHALLTRTVTGAGGEPSSVLSSGPVAACSLRSAAGLARPAVPSAPPAIALAGARDVTASVAIDPIRYGYRATTHVAYADIEIANTGRTTLHAPLILLAIDPHSDFGTARVANARGLLRGHAYWDVSALLPAGGLAPGKRSKPLHVAVHLSGVREPPSNYLTGDAFSMALRLYETGSSGVTPRATGRHRTRRSD